MSMNAALKAVRNAIDAKNFDVAADKAKAILANDADNYHANVFLGLANDKLQKNVDSENAYLAATRIKPADTTGWQGLISLYKKIGRQKLDAYHDAVLKYGQVLADRDDKDRCYDLVNKYADLARHGGTVDQKKQALELQLPTSPFYSFLEGRLPHPSQTYLRLIEITEADEKEYINSQIGERRTRLGARIDLVTLEVKREAFKRSALQDLYEGIINWTYDDAVRREYEEKIIKRGCEELEVLPYKAKRAKREEVLRLAKEMVLIKHPYERAWNIVLEWNDIENYKQWDVGVLREFIEFFPDAGLAKVLKGFLESELSPFPPEEKPKDEEEVSTPNESDDTENPARKESESFENNDMSADQLILMAEGLELARYSVVAHRIMSDLYLSLEEYETTVEIARKGLLNLEDRSKSTGINAPHTTDSLNITLANSLIHHQSPRHHPEAKGIFEKILQRKPTSTNCLLGVGLILKADEDYPNAVDFLQRAQKRDGSNITIRGELSWCKALSGDFETGLEGLQEALNRLITEKPQDKDFKGELYYRIGYCQWELDSSPAARKDRNGAYASFLAAIKSNMNFAPAYTSLGFYYADYKKDKTRARRCFQKAFELSSAEITAAERLARAFANKQEWDLVEAVAKRVVDSGRAKPAPGSKRKGHSWPYAALGTVQVSRQQYAASIVSFQAALRITPDDYHSWVGLAESYHHSGRYVAATKAFEHAQELEQYMSSEEKTHIWFARYMLANVRRELGQYDLAIEGYESILRDKPNDVGNTVALLQTLTESSWKSLHTGLFNSAAELAAKAIKVAQPLAEVNSNIFNMWKVVGDACASFSYIKIKSPMLSVPDCKTLLTTGLDPGAFDIMADLDGVNEDWLSSPEIEDSSSTDSCVYLAILAYKRAIHVSAHDSHAQAVGWYNLGWAEYRAYRSVQAAAGSKDRRSHKYIKAAMKCFKRAIELEAGNAEFWNSLGVVTAGMSPRVSQHSFARSLHLDDRNVQVWTNLGALYLTQNDIPLANQAFTRAQSTDPDYALAWVGQGIVALLYGSREEARGLFEHAFDISQSSDALPKGQYVLTLFDHIVSDSSVSNEVSQLIQPFFAIHQLCAQDPSHLPFVHLSALLAERMGETADAESSLELVCSGMEAEYDQSESPSSLLKFAQANADFARILLAQHEYEKAAEKAETALTLTSDDAAASIDDETCTKLRLSAHLTAGLAYYFTKSMDQAIDMFRDALHEATNSPDVICLLAQVLWAKGGEDERSVARQQLLDCVENHPDHVGAVSLLGAIALLDDDEDVIGAVESDLHNMIAVDDLDIHDRAKLLKLLAAISAKGLNENAELPEDMRQIKESTSAIMMTPGQPQGWMELSAVSEPSYPAEMAISRALRSVPPYGNLEASDLSQAYCQTGKASDAFRSIMVAPWKREGWDELDHSLSTVAA